MVGGPVGCGWRNGLPSPRWWEGEFQFRSETGAKQGSVEESYG